MRLIDADAMHKFVEDKVAEGKDGWAKGVPYEWAYALTAVDAQPTIDAKPVVHAYWKKTYDLIDGHDGYECSACGYTKYFDHYAEGIALCKPYCCECGAKMDGGARNATD